MRHTIRKGDRVRTSNPVMTYRVLDIGPKMARIRCDEPGFCDLRYRVSVATLRPADNAG